MSRASAADIAQLLESARRLTVRVRKTAAPLLGGFGVNIAGRSLLARLDAAGPSTVPSLARHLLMTRQVTQRLADELTEAGWIERQPNPRSQRSHLYALTSQGLELLRTITDAESQFLGTLPLELSAADAGQCLATLQQIHEALASAEP